MPRRFPIALAPLSALVPMVLAIFACKPSTDLSDLRNDVMRKQGDSSAAREKALAVIRKMEKAHGGRDAWLRAGHIEARLRFEWKSLLPKKRGAESRRATLEWRPGGDDSLLTLLDGPNRGRAWGIQNWLTYTVMNSGVDFRPDGDVWFWLPTIQYFIEMPFRIRAADVLVHGGETVVNDGTYELIYATWGGPEPRAKVDQYVLYVEKKSGLLRFVRYTVRDKSPKAASTVYYPEHHVPAGLVLPTAFRKVASPEKLEVKAGVSIEGYRRLPADAKRLVPYPERRTSKGLRGHGSH